jgi:hypothetical protein
MKNETPAPLTEQVLALSKITGQIRSNLQPMRTSLSPDMLEIFSNLETTLFQLNHQWTAEVWL